MVHQQSSRFALLPSSACEYEPFFMTIGSQPQHAAPVQGLPQLANLHTRVRHSAVLRHHVLRACCPLGASRVHICKLGQMLHREDTGQSVCLPQPLCRHAHKHQVQQGLSPGFCSQSYFSVVAAMRVCPHPIMLLSLQMCVLTPPGAAAAANACLPTPCEACSKPTRTKTGSAAVKPSHTRTGSAAGLTRCCCHRGRPTDIYALGACLYTFVFGRIPFNAASVFKLFQVVQHEPLRFPTQPQVSHELKDLLLRMLAKVCFAVLTSFSALQYVYGLAKIRQQDCPK